MKTMAEFERDYTEFQADCLRSGLGGTLSAEALNGRLHTMIAEGNPFAQRAVRAAADANKPPTNMQNSVWDGMHRVPRRLSDGPENMDYFERSPDTRGRGNRSKP